MTGPTRMNPIWRTRAVILTLICGFALVPAVAPATETPQAPSAADSLAQTILALPTEDQPLLGYFIDDQELKSLRSTRQIDFAKQLTRGIAPSEKSPQPLYNKTMTGDGGVAVFRGNIFSEGYFRQHIGQAQFKNPGGGVDTRKVIKGQPWFEWNAGKQSWTLHKDGAQQALLGGLTGPQDFFRGTTIEEWNLIRAYQLLASPQISAADGNELEQKLTVVSHLRYLTDEFQATLKAIAARASLLRKAPAAERNRNASELLESYLKALKYRSWDSTFLTPNQRIAQSWARSALLKWTIEEDELTSFLKTDAIYAGIEFEYLEIAAATRESITSYFKKAQLIPKENYLPPVFDDEARF